MTMGTPDFQDSIARQALELGETHEALIRSISRLTEHDDLTGLLTTLLHEIVRDSNAVSVAVFAYEASRDELYNYAQILRGEVLDVNHDPRVEVFSTPTPASGNPAWEAMLQQQYFWVDYKDPDTRAGPKSTAWHRNNGHGHVCCIPMMNGKQPVGFLGLAFDQSEAVRPTKSRLERAKVLARQAALAMKFIRLAEQTKETALAAERARSDNENRATLLSERNRIAREIHDTLAQSFTGVMMQLRAAHSALHTDTGLVESCLVRAEALAREGLRDARRSVMALRPDAAEFSDLRSKLKWLIEQNTKGTPVAGRVIIEGQSRLVPPDVGFHLFRITQEAVANALRHARPKNLVLSLKFVIESVTLKVIDDGCGIDVDAIQESGGNGVLSMRHRTVQLGGTIEIERNVPSGTIVCVKTPIPLGQ